MDFPIGKLAWRVGLNSWLGWGTLLEVEPGGVWVGNSSIWVDDIGFEVRRKEDGGLRLEVL